MKKAITGIVFFTLMATSVHAASEGVEEGPGPKMRGGGNGQRMAHFQQALGLSDEQVAQIHEIRQNGGGRDEVRGVLTDEQRALMDEHRANRQGRGGQGRGPGRGYGYGPGPANPPGEVEEEDG
jgi:Spy/CpxP family protein refolding chaperone